MKKIIFGLVVILLAVNVLALASAVEVAYVVINSNFIEDEFIEVLDELSISYDLVFSNQISNYDFSSVELMLINNDFFSNWEDIPVNDVPALIVNGRHMDEWGWTDRISSFSQNNPLHIGLNQHAVTDGLDDDIQIYNDDESEMYYLHRNDIFDGLQIIGSATFNEDNGVIVLAEAGSVLTSPGSPDTEINANSIFFGIDEADDWTADSKQLFENSLEWLLSGGVVEFEIEINDGQNLISLPLLLGTTDVAEILALNPEVVSVREFLDDEIVETDTMNNNQGYFLESTADLILTIEGIEASGTQDVELDLGINLIGITSLTEIDLDSLPEEIIEVARRNEDGSYDISTKYFFGWYNEFPLEPGKGYWFKTNEEVTWSYEA